MKFRGTLGEILSALQQHILSDAVFKEIKEIVESQEVDYGRTIYVKGKAFPAGELANRYRALQQQHGSLSAALTSPESIEYLSGVDFQFLDSIEAAHLIKDCKADFREIIGTDTDVLDDMYKKWKKSSCEEIWVSKGT